MDQRIRESDWRVFRELHSTALDRFCERVLAETGGLIADCSLSHHERYLALFQLMQHRDKELAGAFDEMRRSTALLQLVRLRSHALLTEEEFARFTPETREWVQSVLQLSR